MVTENKRLGLPRCGRQMDARTARWAVWTPGGLHRVIRPHVPQVPPPLPLAMHGPAPHLVRLRRPPVRCIASDTGSPSDPALRGYLSTSSSNRYRIGRMARPDGEMAPVNVMCPEPLATILCI